MHAIDINWRSAGGKAAQKFHWGASLCQEIRAWGPCTDVGINVCSISLSPAHIRICLWVRGKNHTSIMWKIKYMLSNRYHFNLHLFPCMQKAKLWMSNFCLMIIGQGEISLLTTVNNFSATWLKIISYAKIGTFSSIKSFNHLEFIWLP